MTLLAHVWQRLKSRAAGSGLTAAGVLLSAYADVLACWSGDDAFTVNVTLFNRLPLHRQVNRILGDFTSMVLVGMPAAASQPFAERASAVQRQLWEGLEHRAVSGIRVLRDLARLRTHADGPLMPVVFTMLDLTAQGLQPPFAALRTLGEVVYSITQTPQVWLDHQVWEEDGALVLMWDSVEDLFPPGLLADMFAAYVSFLHKLADDETAWQSRDRSRHVPPEQLEQRAAVNATDSAIPDDTLISLFLRQAAERPGSPAVITSSRSLSYGQILRQARRRKPDLAFWWRDAGHSGGGGDGQGLGAGGRDTRYPAGWSGVPAGRPLPADRRPCLPAGQRGSAHRGDTAVAGWQPRLAARHRPRMRGR